MREDLPGADGKRGLCGGPWSALTHPLEAAKDRVGSWWGFSWEGGVAESRLFQFILQSQKLRLYFYSQISGQFLESFLDLDYFFSPDFYHVNFGSRQRPILFLGKVGMNIYMFPILAN